MKCIDDLLAANANTENCRVLKNKGSIVFSSEHDLPVDLQYYLSNYESVELFKTADYPITIVGVNNFKKANPIILIDDAENDISDNWFVVATDNRLQYITIDLAKERLGRCYNSFWDRHGIIGEQPIIANSFTELLQALYENKGGYPYWLREDFQKLGDAYDGL